MRALPRSVLSLLATVAGMVALAPPAAAAQNCGKFARPSAVLQVYAIRGVSCRTAVRVAKLDAAGRAPAPWACATSFGGERYRGRPVRSKCGHGGGGAILKRRHAFVVVQRNSAATG